MASFIEYIKKIPFKNAFALITTLLCFSFFYYISSPRFPLSLVKEISDIKISLITILTAVVTNYFGSSNSKGQQQNDKENTQKT